MLINYILVATYMRVFADGHISSVRIEKPHHYVTECLHEGQKWKEEHIRGALIRNIGTVMLWDCVRAPHPQK